MKGKMSQKLGVVKDMYSVFQKERETHFIQHLSFYIIIGRAKTYFFVIAMMSDVSEITTLAIEADAFQNVKNGLFLTCAVRLGST